MSSATSLINDCFLHDKDRLRHDEALRLLRERLTRIVGNEEVDARDGLGRVLSQNIVAPHDVPLHTNAAVDGYAFAHRDFADRPIVVSARIAAGDLNPEPLVPDTAVRIFTGAPMPKGADTVAMQEDCAESDEVVTLPKGLRDGANCRLAGEDLAEGDLVLSAGTRLKAADLAALASIGMSKLPVFKKLRVALFSNGNEMRAPGHSDERLAPGEVYDANQPLLAALCEGLPITLTACGIIEDSAAAARAAISEAATKFDVIITTGGASRGTEDYMLATLDELGKRHMWQLAVKPGRPMMFGQIPRTDDQPDCLFFGLPGNPVAAMVCFMLYTRPALLALAGAKWETPPRFQVPAAFEIKNKKPDRREFMRGILQTDDDGALSVRKFERDGSGLISSLREADGLIEIGEDITALKSGGMVSFIPFSALS